MLFLKVYVLSMFLIHTSLQQRHIRSCIERIRIKELKSFFRDFWDWRLVNNPEFATKVGVYKYDDRVCSLSINSYKRRASVVSLFLRKVRKFKRLINSAGDLELTLDTQLLEHDLEQYLSGMQFNTYVWPINTLEGPQSNPSDTIKIMKKDTTDDLNNIISRIRLFSNQIDEVIGLLKEGIRIKQTLHRNLILKMIPVYQKMSKDEVENTPFFKPFKVKPKCISENSWSTLVNESEQAITNYLQSSYHRLVTFLKKEYLPKCRLTAGISSVPNGKEFYRALLRYHTSTDLTPQQVHDIGLEEIHRINSRMEEIKTAVKFNGTLDGFRKHLRMSKSFGFKNKYEMLSRYKDIRKKVETILPKYFGVLPKTPFVITPVPSDLASSSPMAYYDEPSHGKPGTFFLNTYKPEMKRNYIAESLFLHEAIPGHHLQIALQIEHSSPVAFRRYSGMGLKMYDAPATFSMNTAYTEGWALYAEYLGEEMKMYEDPYVLFGRLSEEMVRACRLVVDTGIHAFGWNRTKSIEFMGMYTADEKHDIESEIDRYIAMPGQACAYKIGERKIKQLRKMAEQELGDKFDIRKFHDFLLTLGNIPLTALEEQIKNFIEKNLSNRSLYHSSQNTLEKMMYSMIGCS